MINIKIESVAQPGRLLHILYRVARFTKYLHDSDRHDLVPEDQFLQVAAIRMPEVKTFKPHKHIRRAVTNQQYIPQESWVVVKGRVLVTYYDINDKVLEQHILNAGDCSITLEGGHNYQALEDDTLVYEFKTGPYNGQEQDKVFI